jgi:hypothetical protein
MNHMENINPYFKNYHSTFNILALFYFIFCQYFEKIFIICAEIFKKSKVQLSGFEP